MDEAEICNKVAIIDHGNIVAFDTPYNLKKQYTSDTVRMRSSCEEDLVSYLKEQAISYKLKEVMFTIYVRSLDQVLVIASTFRSSIGGYHL
jgi:ABC-2 type transport system ATP-binding protein